MLSQSRSRKQFTLKDAAPFAVLMLFGFTIYILIDV